MATLTVHPSFGLPRQIDFGHESVRDLTKRAADKLGLPPGAEAFLKLVVQTPGDMQTVLRGGSLLALLDYMIMCSNKKGPTTDDIASSSKSHKFDLMYSNYGRQVLSKTSGWQGMPLPADAMLNDYVIDPSAKLALEYVSVPPPDKYVHVRLEGTAISTCVTGLRLDATVLHLMEACVTPLGVPVEHQALVIGHTSPEANRTDKPPDCRRKKLRQVEASMTLADLHARLQSSDPNPLTLVDKRSDKWAALEEMCAAVTPTFTDRQIFVKTLTGETLTLRVNSFDLLSTVKEQIHVPLSSAQPSIPNPGLPAPPSSSTPTPAYTGKSGYPARPAAPPLRRPAVGGGPYHGLLQCG